MENREILQDWDFKNTEGHKVSEEFRKDEKGALQKSAKVYVIVTQNNVHQ